MRSNTKKIVLIGLFSALAYVSTLFFRIPISSVEFLKYDPKDFIIIILGFISGPAAAFGVSVVVSLIEAISFSTTGLIGFIMNALSSAAFACPAALIYKKKRTLSGAIIGLITGVTFMCSVMLIWNYIITPMYMTISREAIADMLLPVFLPFNLIKGSINASIAMLLYKPTIKALKTTRLMDGDDKSDGGVKFFVIAVSVLILISCILAVLIIKGII